MYNMWFTCYVILVLWLKENTCFNFVQYSGDLVIDDFKSLRLDVYLTMNKQKQKFCILSKWDFDL